MWQRQVLLLESQGKVTRTFRRLDPERQHAIIEAIFAEAAEHGPQSMHVKRVAARAGVAIGSLYQYFPRRDGMLKAAVDVTVGFLTAALDGYAPMMAEYPLREGLAAYLAFGVEWSAANAGLLSFFVRAAYAGSPGIESLVVPVARSMKGMIRALLEGALRRGELRADLDLEAAIRLVQVLTTAVGDAELVPHLNDYYLLVDADRSAPKMREETVEFIASAIGRAS